MNGIVRSALRVSAIKNVISSTSHPRPVGIQFARSLWNACGRQVEAAPLASARVSRRNGPCACNCYRGAHTEAEKELVEFLAEEIIAEKKARKLSTIPSEFNGFKVSLDGAEVTLEKTKDNETITVSFNINHTVSNEIEPRLIDGPSEDTSINSLRSTPPFNVDITRGNQTLGFSCSFNQNQGSMLDDSNGTNDIFGIDEITLYEGEHSEKVYAVSGQILDGYLYDLLMNYLEEKGVSAEFVHDMMGLSTNYEHTAYISLLEGLSKFTAKK